MPKNRGSHKNKKRQQSSAKHSPRNTQNEHLQGTSTVPQAAAQDWEEAGPVRDSFSATGHKEEVIQEVVGAVQDHNPQNNQPQNEIQENWLDSLPELTELTLWKISEVIAPHRFKPLGLELGLQQATIQILLDERNKVCQEEKTFKMLYRWYADQGGDPSKILFKVLLTVQEHQDQEQIFELFSKERFLCTTLCGRSFQSFQLWNIAEEVHVDKVIPLGLRLGLTYAIICSIREDSDGHSVDVRHNILVRWQKEQTAQIDQVETLARILEACREGRIAYKIRNNHFGVTNEGKTLIISEDQPKQGITEVQLKVTHPKRVVIEEAQGHLQALLDASSSEVRVVQPHVGAAEFLEGLKAFSILCKRHSDLVKHLEKSIGRDGLYKLIGLTLDSIHFHVKVYTTEGLHWLQRDVQSGRIGHELGKVLISSDTKQHFREDIVLDVAPERPDAWDLLSLANKKSDSLKPGPPADSEKRKTSFDDRTLSSSPPSQGDIIPEAKLERHAVFQLESSPAGISMQETASKVTSLTSHAPSSQKETGMPDDAKERDPSTATQKQFAGEAPKKMEDWSEEEVTMWLKSEVHLSDELVSKFEGVDGFTLVRYSKAELREDFELSAGYCRRLILRREDYLEKERLRVVTPLGSMSSESKDENSKMSVQDSVDTPRPVTVVSSTETTSVEAGEMVPPSTRATMEEAVPLSTPATLQEAVPLSTQALLEEAVPLSTPATLQEAVPLSAPAILQEALPLSTPATLQEAVPPSTQATLQEAVPLSTQATLQEAVPLSTQATLQEAVPLSAPATLEEAVPLSTQTTMEEAVPLSAPATLQEAVPLSTQATLQEAVPLSTQAILQEAVPLSTQVTLQEAVPLSTPATREEALPLSTQATLQEAVPLSTSSTPEQADEAVLPSTPATMEEALPQEENMQESSSTSTLGGMVYRESEDIGEKSATTASSREVPGTSFLTERTSSSEDLDMGYTSSFTSATPNPSEVDFEVKAPLYQGAEKGGEVNDPSTEKKLTNLLLGSDKGELDSSYYPVLVVNTPVQRMSSAELEDKFGFMSSVNWNVVFDCNADSNKMGLCQYVNQMKAIKILNAETFTETKDTDTLREGIDFPEVPVWVFPNGRNDVSMKGMEKMSDMDWMRERSNAVLQTVRFFSDPGVIPPGRAVVVFLLLSFSDFMVMAQLFREFYTSKSFQDLQRFTIIAENQGVLHKWIQHLDSHCIVPSKNIRDRCLGGVKWQEINTYMMRLLGSSQTRLPELPLSPKGHCQLMKKHQSQWSDISVIAKNECENTSMDENNPNFLEFVQEKESRFYQGHEVDWWNFFLSEEKFNGGKGYDQVLKRRNYKKLYSDVRKVLAFLGKKVTHISIVTVFHEAGSGGTTVAKNLLWDLHRDYRCAVVNRVTNDTVNQIVAFQKYGYEEGQIPGPVVILLENVESESMRPFLMSLEHETRYIENNGLAFVLIHCKRTSEPQKLQKKEESKLCVCIEHKLTEEEKQWFIKKTEDLEQRNVFSEKESPEQLLAFMVMKEECDPLYLKNVVKGILPPVGKESKKELQNAVSLLKYIAVVQMYHPDFAMPVSACDGFMQNRFRILSSGGRQQTYGPWEKNRLPFLNLLLLEEFIHDIDGCVKGLSIVHPIIASEIVDQLGERFQQRPADMILELLEKSTILDTLSYSKGYIQKVCRDLMVRRLKKEYGDNTETDFSPFIEDVYAEDKAKAFKIMEVGIKKFQDPFIAQQKARLHSKRESDPDNAEQAINIALGIVSNNSYLWDTKGIILREKMIKYERREDQEAITNNEMKELLDTFNESCKAFQNAQKAMEEETTRRNYAGFVGEITTITKFLDIVQKSVRPFCHRTRGLETLRRYLMTEYIPPELNTLPSLLEFSDTMKMLSERVDKALGRFTDYLAHCAQQRFGRATYRIYDEKLEKIYVARNRYFASRKIEDAHAQYPVETAYAMRRAEVKKMNADGYHQIFELASTSNVEELTRAKELLSQNLGNPNLFDIKNFVFTVFALSVCTSEGLNEDEARKSVSTLKRMEERAGGFYGLFFEMLLNWPDGTTREGSTPIAETIRELHARWTNRYRNKGYVESPHNLPRRSKMRQQSSPLKPATEFYLGLQNEKSRFVHRKSIGRVTYSIWKEESIKRKLKRLDGVLDSKHFVLYNPDGQEPVKIILSLPIKGLPSQEPVQFYLGFSFAGPLAYDVVYKDNRETPFIAKESSYNYPSYVKELDDMDEGPVSYEL